MKKHLTSRTRWALLGLFAWAASAANASVMLVDVTMPGLQETVAWESPDLNNANTSLTPTTGTGTITPISPGYQASAGFYSWQGDFGAEVTSSSTFDTQNVVFQLVMMANPDYTTEQILNYDGSYLPEFDMEVGYAGGPTLNYNGGTQGIQATLSEVVAGPTHTTISGFEGELSSYAWQWDLSGITDDISSVSITAPIIAHQSTVEARLDLGSSFSSLAAVPEPQTYALMLGGVALAFAAFRRRRVG
ncbi:MAG: PEP-CTERM putative exosortase interaction domain-containing protein [Puniceicoccaceae bacterium 5H]|nr:MAG: PEP-CTERM putative exosortase interaction domain-containing protein [Puniceicoccaceae bacterium 5H]